MTPTAVMVICHSLDTSAELVQELLTLLSKVLCQAEFAHQQATSVWLQSVAATASMRGVYYIPTTVSIVSDGAWWDGHMLGEGIADKTHGAAGDRCEIGRESLAVNSYGQGHGCGGGDCECLHVEVLLALCDGIGVGVVAGC